MEQLAAEYMSNGVSVSRVVNCNLNWRAVGLTVQRISKERDGKSKYNTHTVAIQMQLPQKLPKAQYNTHTVAIQMQLLKNYRRLKLSPRELSISHGSDERLYRFFLES